jgi:gliding motility-associated-like protein
MPHRSFRYIRLIIIALLFFYGSVFNSFSQTSIGGIVNKYAHVDAIGVDYVEISDETRFQQFSAGDTVMMIQMKGVEIFTGNVSNYGSPISVIGKPGQHEFFLVDYVDDPNNRIYFFRDIITSFDVTGLVQLVKVPSYKSAIVTSTLTAAVWDSASMTGGILAFFAGKELTLDAPIDVSGKGFKGAERVSGSWFCAVESGSNEYVYSFSSDSSGFKGEGISIQGNDTLFARGKGPDFIGGGGGNGGFSGGGGGANYGDGGYGGEELSDCSIPWRGGTGGFGIVYPSAPYEFDGGLYLGGGGGGARYSTGIASNGGNGGGIAIIICDSIFAGTDNRILANGVTPSIVASGYAGAGGGGAGGSIAIYAQGFSTNGIVISAKGGNGGSHSGSAGEGGGGGGGYITINNVPLTNVTLDVSFGEKGNNAGVSVAYDGTDGATANDFKPLLNGFLFNTIWSTVTGNDVDSICSNVVPKLMTGSKPSGSGSFTYQWEYSPLDFADTIAIAGATSLSYTPSALLTDTIWIRRVVTDNGASPTVVDESRWILMIVQPKIENNSIAADTIICYGQTPGTPITSLTSTPTFGNGSYAYGWIDSDNTSSWVNAPIVGAANESYTPPVLYDTTYYKRIVTSGRCIDTSSYVTITVLPALSGNITVRSDSIICEGSLFNGVSASDPSGGDGVAYTYLWQESLDNSTWSDAYGTNVNPTYVPDTSRFAIEEEIYYRRRVLSGPYDVCLDYSSPILMTRYHKIENNTIAADDVICAGSDPVALTGSSPLAGSGSYTYIWQDSTSSGSWSNVGTASAFDPAPLTDSTWYRRIVNSSVCADTSSLVVINVHATIENNVSRFISGAVDTTICYGSVPNTIHGAVEPELTGGTDLPGDYAYQWLESTDNVTYSEITTYGTLSDYSPGPLIATTWYKRRVISGECIDESLPVKITVLAQITNNIISQDQTVCYNTVPNNLTGPFPDGGDPALVTWLWEQSTDGGTNWSTASGTSNLQDYVPPALTVETAYRRIIVSGENNCCVDTSAAVIVAIHDLPTAAIVGATEITLCEGEDVPINIELTGASNWDIVYSENGSMISVNGVSSNSIELIRQPVPTASLSTYDYTLFSVVDANGCSATSMIGSLKANVYRNPVANGGGDAAVCGPEFTLAAVPSDGTGAWTFPAEVVDSDGNFYNASIKIDSSFTGASVIYDFTWEESNWNCTDADVISIEFFNRIDPVTAGSDTALMTFDNVVKLSASPLMSYETGEWTVEYGSGSFIDKNASTTEVRNAAIGSNSYKWTVVNGECTEMATINVDLFDVVVPEGISPNGDGINDVMTIKGLELESQIAELTIVNSGGNKIYYTTNRDGSVWTEWNGTNSNGSAIPEGTYHYILKVESQRTGVEVSRSGFVILKRR